MAIHSFVQGRETDRMISEERLSMRLLVTVDRDEDGFFVVECPAILGCVSQGKTEAEALENIKDAIRHCLEVRAERGMPLTVKTHEIEIAV